MKQMHKLILDKDDKNNTEFRKHLQNLGFKTSVAENTDLLRSLFCREIEENVESYKIWVDFDINEEVSKFPESGWFNSSLGDLCVLACSNLLQASIVVSCHSCPRFRPLHSYHLFRRLYAAKWHFS